MQEQGETITVVQGQKEGKKYIRNLRSMVVLQRGYFRVFLLHFWMLLFEGMSGQWRGGHTSSTLCSDPKVTSKKTDRRGFFWILSTPTGGVRPRSVGDDSYVKLAILRAQVLGCVHNRGIITSFIVSLIQNFFEIFCRADNMSMRLDNKMDVPSVLIN